MMPPLEEIYMRIEERWEILKRSITPIGTANHVRIGAHPSGALGSGIEFDRIREYEPREDKLADIYWEATLSQAPPFGDERERELLVKKFIEPKEVPMMIVADMSFSMCFGAEVAPAHTLMELTGIFARVATYRGDSVGAVGFRNDVEFYLKPQKGRKYANALIDEEYQVFMHMYGRRGISSTNMNAALEYLAGAAKTRSFVVVLSDFLGVHPEIDWTIVDELASKHDVLAVILKNPEEDKFNVRRGYVKIRDAESGDVRRYAAKDVRRILANIRAARASVAAQFEERGASAVILAADTEGNYLEPLAETLLERRKR